MFRLKHIFGLFTLQIGVALISTILFSLAVCIFEVNVVSVKKGLTLSWIVMFLFISVMAVIWSIAFTSAYKESYRLVSVAAILWTIYIIIWTALVIWLFVDAQNKIMCHESRCIDGLWLFRNSQYYNSKYNGKKLTRPQPYRLTERPPNYNIRSIYEKTFKSRSVGNKTTMNDKRRNRYKNKKTHLNTEHLKQPIEEVKTDFAKPETNVHRNDTVSIIVSLIYIFLMLYSWIVLVSYRKELQFEAIVTSHDSNV